MAWDLAGKCYERVKRSGVLVLALAAGNVVLAAYGAMRDAGPRYVIRSDREGHADLVLLPQNQDPTLVARQDARVLVLNDGGAPTLQEAQDFLELVVMRLFSWDAETRESDRAYVLPRLTEQVRARLPKLVPGYSQSLKRDAKGRVDTEVHTTRVLSDTLPFQLEVELLIDFSGDYLPDFVGERDKANPRHLRYGYLFVIDYNGRSRDNPSGLVVSGITPVQYTGGES